MIAFACFRSTPVGGELSLGLRHLGVDPGLLALEGLDVDGVEVVGAKELVALVSELAETAAEEHGSFCPVPLALGHLGSEGPLQSCAPAQDGCAHPHGQRSKCGKDHPVKSRITGYLVVGIADPSSFVYITSGNVTCNGGDPIDAIDAYSGDLGVQYLGNGNWQFNWKTSKMYSGRCRIMRLNLADGLDSREALFQFK